MRKFTTKQWVQTALLLAVCIVSQLFKNLSPYITGPIVNTVLIIATLAVSIYSGLIISIISPLTAFLITGSPIMAAVPLMFPCIMFGNVILVCSAAYFHNRKTGRYRLAAGLLLGSVCKAAFLGVAVVWILLPMYSAKIAAGLPNPQALPKVLAAARITFSVTQLITALTGSLAAYLIWIPLKRYLNNPAA